MKLLVTASSEESIFSATGSDWEDMVCQEIHLTVWFSARRGSFARESDDPFPVTAVLGAIFGWIRCPRPTGCQIIPTAKPAIQHPFAAQDNSHTNISSVNLRKG